WPGPLMPVFGLLSFAGFIALVLAVILLVSTGSLWGWPLPDGMPIWTGVLILAVLFHVFTIPLRVARRAYRYGWGWHYAWAAAWDGVFGIVLLAFVFWMFFRHLPPPHNLHEFFQNVPDAIRGAVLEISGWFRALADKF